MVPDIGLFIVADGMGGHNAGEVASRQAIESIVEFLRRARRTGQDGAASNAKGHVSSNGTDHSAEESVVAGIKLANRDVCNLSLQHQEYNGMGTTLVAMLVEESTGRVAVAHVGDSRCYRLRHGEMAQLTLDHSWVTEQLQKGILTVDEAKNHRWRNVITRALGNKLDVEVDVQPLEVESGDLFLLCSDGLSSMIDDEQIACILRSAPNLEDCAQNLIQGANAAGGYDNISVVLVRFFDEEALRKAQADDAT